MSIPTDLRNSLSYPKEVIRNYFAQRTISAWELPGVMRKHIYTGAMGSLYYTLIGGMFFIYFGNAIGISRPLWGVMSGVSSFMLASQLISALITERLGQRKLVWFAAALVGRSFRIAGIMIALWLWHTGLHNPAMFLVVAVIISNFFDALAEPPWLSWLADIIPEDEHGRFWGRRAAWISLATILVVVPASFMMDRLGQDWKIPFATCMFAFAGALGIIDLFIHGTLPEPALVIPEQSSVLGRVLKPLVDRTFRPWLLFTCVWSFSMTLGGSLAWLYFMDELGIRDNFLGGTLVMTAIPLVGSVFTGKWSGKLVDKAGTARVLFWGHIFWATLPLFWLVATPSTALVVLSISSLVGGTSSTAATNAANKFVTRLPAQEDRAMYAAISRCVGNFAGGIGALCAGGVLALLGDWHVSIFGWTFAAFHVLFLSSLVLRVSSAVFFIGQIHDPEPEAADAPPQSA